MLLFAICVLPALAVASRSMGARPLFVVQGKVYCDTCQAGFETPASTYVPGNLFFFFLFPFPFVRIVFLFKV